MVVRSDELRTTVVRRTVGRGGEKEKAGQEGKKGKKEGKLVYKYRIIYGEQCLMSNLCLYFDVKLSFLNCSQVSINMNVMSLFAHSSLSIGFKICVLPHIFFLSIWMNETHVYKN